MVEQHSRVVLLVAIEGRTVLCLCFRKIFPMGTHCSL